MGFSMAIFRKICALLLVLGFLAAVPVPASADGELQLASEAAVLMDAETGQVLYEKNMHRKLYPASITKVMTAYLALKELDPTKPLTVSQEAVNAVPRTSSHIGLQPGEVLTMEQAMYAIGMESANDAANVLAEAVSGSLEAFGQRMTSEAAAMGAINTNFTNSNGLPDSKHVTTAYDMALITRAALGMPGFTEYFSRVEYLFPATNLSDVRPFSNKDRLLPGGQYAYDGVLMAKTGFTSAAQGTFVAVAQRAGTTLIVVALKSPLLEDKYRDTHKLLDYGFAKYFHTNLTGEAIAARLELGEYAPVKGQAFSILLPTDANMNDIEFALAEGTGLPDALRGNVTVTAALPEVLIPNITLEVELPTEPEPEPAGFELTELEQEIVTTVSITVYIALGAAALAFLWSARHRYIKARNRRDRRRKLDARIRNMKRRMK